MPGACAPLPPPSGQRVLYSLSIIYNNIAHLYLLFHLEFVVEETTYSFFSKEKERK